MMRVLDLFSGIGGFSLGLERAGMRTVAFCEIDPYCRRVLAKHWPDVPIYGDIRELTAEKIMADAIDHGWQQQRRGNMEGFARPTCGEGNEQTIPIGSRGQGPRIDLICGGFPCQDISVAGKGAGIGGERSGLWLEYARIIGEVRPRYVIVENVAALLGRGLERVLGDLAALGFDAEWHCIPASAVGAPHRRDRLWIIAHASSSELRDEPRRRNGTSWTDPAELGDDGASRDVADAAGPRLEGRSRQGMSRSWGASIELTSGGDAPDANSQPAQRLAISWGECGHWRTEPDVGRVAHGVPARVDRLRALGNAVVPQIPEIIGRAILAAEAAASYDGAHGHNDLNKSWNECLRAVRERVAAGGPGWTPKEAAE